MVQPLHPLTTQILFGTPAPAMSSHIFGAQGSVKLDRGTTHLLRRSDVEHLVRQGLLQELENEST